MGRRKSSVATALIGASLAASMLSFAPTRAADCPAPAAPAGAPAWPPPPEPGAFDVAHFGEAHYNEGQGPVTMPVLVQDLVAYAPTFVAFSSDMADVGKYDRMTCFRSIMEPVRTAGIPWYDSPGNHDRLTIGDTFGGVLSDSIAPWRDVFKDSAAPWGDAPAPAGFVIPAGEPDDGIGASTHYYVDYAPGGSPAVRLIVLDNSRHSFGMSDVDQYPRVGPGEKDASQLAFFHRAASDARDKGLLTFVMFHEPTQDPRDQTQAYPISYNHTMAKGVTADNQLFDALAVATGTDAVLAGHILGNFQYRLGDVAYYIDGGGGGTPYSTGATGTDSGYYYAWRLLRVYPAGGGWAFRTYVVPLADRIEVTQISGATVGSTVALSAVAVQPHDPTLPARFPLQPNAQIRVELRPPSPSALEGGSLPSVAYMWSTSDPAVLEPVPDAANDPAGDPAFDAATMTTSGRFQAVGAGTATITIASGTHSATVTIVVA